MDGVTQALGFDPDALREKYQQERDKRLRDDGADQYIEMAGQFASFAEDDPYVEPGFSTPTSPRSRALAADRPPLRPL